MEAVSRIQACFERCKAEGRSALIPFMTAGDPAPEHTLGQMHALVAGGADILELGLPFSDPMADGPTIQLACERALAAGTTSRVVLDIVKQFRQTNTTTPVVLMGYLNPMLRNGAEMFAESANAAGVDGVLAVDLSVEEAEALQPALAAQGLDCIFLMAPTTSAERAAKMSQVGSGYIYYVSLKGVTGSAALDIDGVAHRLADLRSVVTLPIAVGFGIRNADQVAAMAEHAEGIVVGSALVDRIAEGAEHPDRLPATLQEAVADLRAGIDRAAK